MIITIAREHGSNGHLIAKELAAALGYTCYDKEIVDHAAEDSGFSPEILRNYDEKKVSAYVVPAPHYMGMGEGFRLNMQIATAQFDTIRKLADKGDAVFVGRCADYVLRNRKDILRVFIMADKDFRIRTLMRRKDIKYDQAKRLMREVDKDRSSYYKYYTDQIWGEPENYELCVNSRAVGVKGAVDVIMAYAKAMEEKKKK